MVPKTTFLLFLVFASFIVGLDAAHSSHSISHRYKRGDNDGSEDNEIKDVDINIAVEAIINLPDTPPPIKAAFTSMVSIGNTNIINSALTSISSTMKPGMDMVKAFLVNMNKLAGTVKDAKVGAEIVKSTKDILSFIVTSGAKLEPIVTAAIGKATKLVVALSTEAKKFADFLINGLTKVMELINKTVVFKFSLIARTLTRDITSLIGQLKTQLTDACENVLEVFQGKPLQFLSGLRTLVTFSPTGVHSLLSHLVNLLGTIASVLGDALSPILNSVFKVTDGITIGGGATLAIG